MGIALSHDAVAGSGLAYRLTFLLPDSLVLGVGPGRHCPCLHGCVLTVGRGGLVTIEGPSRERVFDQVARFLRVISKDRPPLEIAAVLTSPFGGRRDPYTIIVNATVSIVPCGLGASMIGGSTASERD